MQGTGIDKLLRWLNVVALLAGTLAATLAGLKSSPPTSGTQPPTGSPTTPPIERKYGRLDPHAAIGRQQFGKAGCTGTVIGPRRSDGRWDVATAAHCLDGTPSDGTLQLKDGTTLAVTRVKVDQKSDVAWCVTTLPHDDLPYALLADSLPAKGDKVWHAGYGFDKPGNTEQGAVTVPQTDDGQTEFLLSVSSGDSGGAIALDASGRVIATVCCTTRIAGPGRVWGASVESLRKTRPIPGIMASTWTPIPVPTRDD